MTALDSRLFDLFPQAKLIRLQGYSNGNKDYTEAKRPTGIWKDVAGLSREDAKACLEENGWLGLVIPEGYILIDVDDKETGHAMHEALSGKMRCITIETPNGYQFLFKDNGKVKSQGAKMLTIGGFVVDYRITNRGYIVLPTVNTENRKVVHGSEVVLDDMPLMFVPARRVNTNDMVLQIPIHKGNRNDTLFREVASRAKGLNEKHRLGLNDKERLAVMEEINAFFCETPLPEKELEAIFKSAERYESATPPAVNETRITDLDNLFINASDILNGDYDPDDYPEIIEGMLPKGSLAILIAPPSSFKTWVALYSSIAISMGKPFLKRQTTQTPVIYIDRENPISVWRIRLEKSTKDGAPDSLKLWTTFCKKEPPPFPNEVYIQIAKEHKPVMIFDSLIRFFPQKSDENSSKDMAVVMKFLRELTNNGATVLVLHHKGKSEQSDFRGSSEIVAGVDIAYTLSKDAANKLTLKCIKNRFVQEETLIIGISEDEEGYMTFDDLSAQERDAMTREHEGKYLILQGIISSLEKEGKEANQARVAGAAKEKMGMSVNKTRDLLKKGLKKYWDLKEVNSNHRVYTVELFGFSTPIGIEKLESSFPADPDFPREDDEEIPTIEGRIVTEVR